MAELIHYTDPQSRGMRTQMLLDVFQIPHRRETVELRKGDHKKPEYAKIHPYQRVPALQHGDTTVIESGAISLYLADLFAEKMNTPRPGTPERALLYEWVFFLQTTLEPYAMKSFHPDNKAEAKEEIGKLLATMGERIKGPFVLGEQFSVADVILFCELSWYQMMGLYPEGQPAYDQFMQVVEAKLKA
jgi:glutathione S-transferase